MQANFFPSILSINFSYSVEKGDIKNSNNETSNTYIRKNYRFRWYNVKLILISNNTRLNCFLNGSNSEYTLR